MLPLDCRQVTVVSNIFRTVFIELTMSTVALLFVVKSEIDCFIDLRKFMKTDDISRTDHWSVTITLISYGFHRLGSFNVDIYLELCVSAFLFFKEKNFVTYIW